MAKGTTKETYTQGSRQDEAAGTRRAVVQTMRTTTARVGRAGRWDDDTDWEQHISTDIPPNVPLDRLFR